MTLRIVTDSSCDLPADIARANGIIVVPCSIHFGQESYHDGVDMQPEAFYARLSGNVHPTTSQPPVEAFLHAYKTHQGKADEVLSLHISSKLSATVNSARLAKEQLGDSLRIEVVDSIQVSLGLGLLALEAARLANNGASLKDVTALIEREKARVVSYVSVDTLDDLVRGGRASKLQGFFGGLLNIKPILAVKDDGEVHPVERVRTRRRVVERLVEIVGEQRGLRALGILHSVASDDAEALAKACAPHFPREKMVLAQFSAVLGSHVGPRALGVAIWAGA